MAWIFAAVVVVLAVYSPDFRKVALVIGGAAGVFAFFARVGEFDRIPSPAITHNSSAKRLAVRPPKRIPTEQIEVGELRANSAGEGVSSIDVRIHNHSAADTLASVDYALLIDDCQGTETEPSHCATVSDEKGTIVLEVPPTQARDVTINAHEPYSDVTMLGHPRIKMIITAARATRTTSQRASDGRIAEGIPVAQNGEGNR
jgi:hypothetical protein